MSFDYEENANLTIRHAISAAQLGKGSAAKIVRLLNSADADLVATLAGRYALIEKNGFDRGPATTKRLEEMLAAIRDINTNVYAKVAKGLRADLADAAAQEAEFAARAAKKAGASVDISSVLPTPTVLKTLVEKSPIPVDQHGVSFLDPWLKTLETKRRDRLEAAITQGFTIGETTDDLVKRIRGTKANGYTDGILDISRRSAQSLALTAHSSVQNAARVETYKAMKTIRYVEWSSVLDGRTSPICQSRSGQIYNIDEPHPTPPAHLRCRSILIPRRDNTTPAKHKPFGDWLRGQSEDVQDEVLGRSRADIFRQNGQLDFAEFFRKDGTYKTIDELKAFDAKITASEPTTVPVAKAAKAPFTSPINPNVTAETITVEPRRNANNALSGFLKEAAADGRYSPTPEFLGAKVEHFGKASLIGDFTDESASMVSALMPELDTLADAFNVPRLRGVKTGSGRAIGTMGDGLLTLNGTYFNGYATGVGGKVAISALDEIAAQHAALSSELKAMSDELGNLKVALRDLTGAARDKATHELLDKAEAFNAKREEWLKLDKKLLKARTADAVTKKTVSTWKVGDGAATRPFNATDYFADGIDKARMVMFHEFAHHVHQMYKKLGPRRQFGAPPLERELATLFRTIRNRDTLPSKYSTTNGHEWWAESFGLYMMGRKDLVDETVAKLIERLLNEVANGD